MTNLLVIAAVVLLLKSSASTALDFSHYAVCDVRDGNVDLCEEAATLFNDGVLRCSGENKSHQKRTTSAVEISNSLWTSAHGYSSEFNVTLNGKNNDTAISTLYLQVCGLSHKQRIDLFNEKEPVFIEDNQWRVSSCTLQNDIILLINNMNNRRLNQLCFKITLSKLYDMTLRTLVIDNFCTLHGPVDASIYEESQSHFVESTDVSKKRTVKRILKRASETQQISDYIIVANELYVHQLSLDGSRVKTLASGLGNARAIDYDLRRNYLYWTDTTKKSIMRSNLDGTNIANILGQTLQEPAGVAVDWINNKLYWTDVQTRWIGVMDLNNRYYKMLLATETDANPREIVVDPTRRKLYWAEWGSHARIKSSSMDGFGVTTIHSTDLVRPYAVTLDIETQSLYWADNILDKVETSSVNGVGRQTITTTGVPQVFSITVFGNILYLSDRSFGVRRMNSSSGEAPTTIFNNFCDFVYPYGIRIVSHQQQPQDDNPCETNNGGCSHFCLLSAVDSKNYSCACPSGMVLDNDTLNCLQSNAGTVQQANMTGSCRRAGYAGCCSSGLCTSSSGNCFCDVDCHIYGDCCVDLADICSTPDMAISQLVVSNLLYIQGISLDGKRTKTIHSGLTSAVGVDFNFRNNYLYWSTNNGLWQSRLNGFEVLLLLNNHISNVDDIALDWISDKLYWTDDGFDRIGVFDLTNGYYSILIDTEDDSSPRGIITDPINKLLYWCDWGVQAKIETASMDGTGRSVIHDTGLVWPNGLTLDHAAQVLYWIDANHDRIESSFVNGSNRIVVASSGISRPFSITLFRDKLFFTDRRTIRSVPKTGGTVQTINNLCAFAYGIEVVAEERQPNGFNPCAINNGGCAHICLLSSTNSRDYACACHIGFTLDTDMANCSSGNITVVTPNVEAPSHGTCAAANYSGCCRSGLCRGSPPTCSCDPLCSVFQDCCIDFSPCPLVTVSPGNTTLILSGSQQTFQFHCDVDTYDTFSVNWTFMSTISHQISDIAGSFNVSLYTFQDETSSNLTINNVWFLDDGIYTCVVTTESGEFGYQASSRLKILVVPSKLMIKGNTSYSETNALVLECMVSTYPSPTIVWVKRDTNVGSVILNSQRTNISFNYDLFGEPSATSRLRISELTASDNGIYSCKVKTSIPGYSTVSTHVSISIEEINECERSNLCQNGGSCSELVRGYTCQCTNSYTGRHCTHEIRNDVPQMQPNLTETPVSMEASIASPVNLTCSAEGYPPPTYQWYKDGVAVPGATQSFLYIPELLPDDRGVYVCKANNTVGQMTSDYARVNISDVKQYLAILMLNQSTTSQQAFEQALDAINCPRMDSNPVIYGLQKLIMNVSISNEAVFLVTTVNGINSSTSLLSFIRTSLESIPAIMMVKSLIRYDGCQSDTVNGMVWPDSNIGEVNQLPCPCEELLQSGKLSSRSCGGTYSQGGQWMNVNYSQCDSINNEITNTLCRIALNTNGNPVLRLAETVNITSQPLSLTANDVILMSLLIQELRDEAINNPEIWNNYLRTIDNIQQVNRHAILISEAKSRSLSRVLLSLDKFLDKVDINSTNTTSINFSYRTFAIQVQNIDISSLNGQTFNVDLGSVDEARNMMGDIDDSNLITRENVMEALSNATAAIHISEELLNHCTPRLTNQRLSYSVFLFDSFFLSQNPNETIGSLIIAARLKCGSNTTVPPINFTLLSSNDVNASQGACARWNSSNEGKFGTWSRSGCRENMIEGNKRMCQCSQLGNFGILLDLTPSQLPGPLPIIFSAISYIGAVVSLICLLIFISSYLAIKKLRTSTHGQIILSMSFSLIGLYVIFIVSGQVTVILPLCGISSALLHYFLLVFFAWTGVEAVWFYLKLVKTSGIQSTEQHFFKVSSLLSWLLPLIIVLTCAGAGYRYYNNSFYCRATEWPFWFGLILPLLVMYLFNWIMFTIIVVSTCKDANSTTESSVQEKEEHRRNTKNFIVAIGLSITYGLGWVFGFLATTDGITELTLIIFQSFFTVIITIHGIVLFITYGICNQEIHNLWKRILFSVSRRIRRVSSHSFNAELVATVDTNPIMDFEANPAYANTERKDVAVRKNVAYETVQQNISDSVTSHAYETVKQDLSAKEAVYETIS